MKDANLDTSAMLRDPSVDTSSTVVLVSPDGERSFLHYYGGNARISEDEVNYDIIETAKILHVAAAFLVPGLDGVPMARGLARARKMGVKTVLDTAWDAEGRWMQLVEPCLHHVDMFVPSLDEAQMLTQKQKPSEIAKVLQSYGVTTVVIKLGADGCFARTSDHEFSVPAFRVDRVVDTLGAGDCFVAGFIAGLVKGWHLKKTCRFANAVGAACVSARGASGIRPMQEIAKLYRV